MFDLMFGLLAGFTLFYVYKSLYFLERDHTLDSYQFGTHHMTYYSGSLPQTLDAQQQGKVDNLPQARLGYVFWFFRDFLWAWWLIDRTVRNTTQGAKIKLAASDIFSEHQEGKNGKQTRYRVNLQGDPTMQIRVITMRYLLQSVALRGSYIDLTKTCRIKSGNMEYTDTVMAKVLLDHSQELFAEALRKAAAMFTWEGDDDIIRHKEPLEIMILHTLSQEGSILQQGRILKRPGKVENFSLERLRDYLRTESIQPHEYFGDSCLSVDINVEDLRFAPVTPDTPEAAQAVNRPFVAVQEGRRLTEEGAGRARAATAVVKELKIDPALAYAVDATRERPVTFNQFGGGVMDLVRGFIGQTQPQQPQPNPSNTRNPS